MSLRMLGARVMYDMIHHERETDRRAQFVFSRTLYPSLVKVPCQTLFVRHQFLYQILANNQHFQIHKTQLYPLETTLNLPISQSVSVRLNP